MEFSLRRHVWVIDLIGIMFGAGLAGHAVATRLAPERPDDGWTPARSATPIARAPVPEPFDGPCQVLTRAEVLAGIRRLGPHLYEVPRGILDQRGGISPPAPVIVPETRDGKAAGVRIFGVDRDALPAAIGLVSGDVLLKINGFELTDPQSALTAYTALKTATHAWLVLERDGRRIRLDYVVR